MCKHVLGLRDGFVGTAVDVVQGLFGGVTRWVNRVSGVSDFIEHPVPVLGPLFGQFLAQVPGLLKQPVTGVYGVTGPAASL